MTLAAAGVGVVLGALENPQLHSTRTQLARLLSISSMQEHRLLMPGGNVKYVRVVGHPSANHESGTFEFVGAVMDVTQRHQADAERERLQELQADLAHITRMTTMGELTASLAHEIKQPIAAAVTNAKTCLRWLDRADPEIGEACEAASRAVKDVTRAADIINRIGSLFKKGPRSASLLT